MARTPFLNRLRVEIDGESKAAFDRAFNRLARELEDWTEIFEDIGILHGRWLFEQFLTQGAAGDTPWPDLSEAYEERKLAANPFALNILQLTNKMHLSFIRKGYSGSDGANVWLVGKKEAAFGSTDRKARWHQEGTSRMPMRRIEVMSNSRRTELMKLVQRHLLAEVRRTGLGTLGQELRNEGSGGGIAMM